MQPGQGTPDLMLASTSSTVGETVTCRVDTLGYDFCAINLHLTSTAASSNKLNVCKISHGATTTAASATDITRLVGGGVGGFTIPAAPTAASSRNVLKFNVDVRGKQRYLFLTVSVATTHTLTALAELGRGDQAGSAALQNVLALVEG